MISAAFFTAGRTLQSQTFYSSGTWVAPLTTSRLESASGKGADGAPGTDPSYGTGTAGPVAHMVYLHDSTAIGAPGNITWYNFNQAISDAVAIIRSGYTSGPIPYSTHDAEVRRTPAGVYYHTESFPSGSGTTPTGNIVPNTAYSRIDGPSASSGSAVTGSALFESYGYVDYQYAIAGTGSAPTTGSAASIAGLGLSFPGGTGGAAATTNYGVVTVTPGTSYAYTVPAGGTITITYWA